jgi:hypothetical protein
LSNFGLPTALARLGKRKFEKFREGPSLSQHIYLYFVLTSNYARALQREKTMFG